MKRLRKITADTGNIHAVSNDDSIAVFKPLYNKLIDEGYAFYLDREEGCWGCYGYQVPALGVQNPIIYLIEIYYLIKNKEKITIVLEHHYDTNGNISQSAYQAYNGELWATLRNQVKSGSYRLADGNMFIPTDKTSYNDTKIVVDSEVAQRNENLVAKRQ